MSLICFKTLLQLLVSKKHCTVHYRRCKTFVGRTIGCYKKKSVSSQGCDNADSLQMLELLKNIFKNFASEYMRLKQFSSSDTFITPHSLTVGQKKEKKINSRITMELTNCTYQYIPIEKTLKAFLELPGVFELIKSYMCELNTVTGCIINLVQTPLWKDMLKLCQEDKFILPILLYVDDFEINNPLGSHAGTCGVYFALGCMPPEYSFQLNNIFLLQLCQSKDEQNLFHHIVHALKSLEKDGLTININSQRYTIYFSLALILGDNLGIHSMLGLNESFNSTYYCRFCRCQKSEAANMLSENKNLLRTPENYENDLSALNYGIKEKMFGMNYQIFI